jgi:hypothetical protein
MKIIKLFFGIFTFVVLTSCAQNTALLGPAYSLVSTGNVYQAGLTYTSDQAVTKITGKSTGENVKQLITSKKKDNEFEKLVKERIKKTRKKLKLSN